MIYNYFCQLEIAGLILGQMPGVPIPYWGYWLGVSDLCVAVGVSFSRESA